MKKIKMSIEYGKRCVFQKEQEHLSGTVWKNLDSMYWLSVPRRKFLYNKQNVN